MAITSQHVKTALLAYWRFKRQAICGDEVDFGTAISDILVDTGEEIIEIEVKTAKGDLWADAKKPKHGLYKLADDTNHYACPNKFYVCVPTYLVEEAKAWIAGVNPKYGIIELSQERFEKWFKNNRKWDSMLKFIIKAKTLRETYKTNQKRIALRLCSAHTNMKIDFFQGLNK